MVLFLKNADFFGEILVLKIKKVAVKTTLFVFNKISR